MEYKVFGIGLSRTGTRSLAEAFQLLGYNFLHNPHLDTLLKGQHDGASDISIFIHFKTVDKKFPGSRFILTVREKEDWLDSMRAHFNRKTDEHISLEMQQDRIAIYGQSTFNKEIFSTKYDQYVDEVRTYFVERPDDLLIMNICGGDSWDKLIPFIEHEPFPTADFPHKNTRVQP